MWLATTKPKYIFTFYATGTPSPHAPFTPAPQYENEFQDVTAPRIPSFNHVEEDHEAKHWFVRRQPRPLNDTLIGMYVVCAIWTSRQVLYPIVFSNV